MSSIIASRAPELPIYHSLKSVQLQLRHAALAYVTHCPQQLTGQQERGIVCGHELQTGGYTPSSIPATKQRPSSIGVTSAQQMNIVACALTTHPEQRIDDSVLSQRSTRAHDHAQLA